LECPVVARGATGTLNTLMATGFNLFDLLIFLVIIKIVVDGYQGSLINEVFLLLSVVFAVIIGAHYYWSFGVFLGGFFSLFGSEYVIAYGLISCSVMALYPVAREGWRVLLNPPATPAVNPWITALVALVRAYFLAAVILTGLTLTGQDYVVNTTRASFSRFYLKDVVGDLYRGAYDGVISLLAPGEPFNRHLFETLSWLDGDNERQGLRPGS
jgi:hypothetical protein